MKKRIVSGLLALCILLGLPPVTASAAEDPVYPVGTRVLLGTDPVPWLVLSNYTVPGSESITFVRDGFLAEGPYTDDQGLVAIQRIETFVNTNIIGSTNGRAMMTAPETSQIEALGPDPFTDNTTRYWVVPTGESEMGTMQGNGSLIRGNGGSYECRPVLRLPVTALSGITVQAPPAVTVQPRDVNWESLNGADAVFTAETEESEVTRQWQARAGEEEPWADIAGETGTVLTVSAGSEYYAPGSEFRCALTGDARTGTVYTQTARLVERMDWLAYGERYAVPDTDYTLSGDENTLTVHTAAGFGWVAARVNDGEDSYRDKTVTLDRDIDLSGRQWVPVGSETAPFEGAFNGEMHSISGLEVAGDGQDGDIALAGLFGYTLDALLERVFITDGTLTAEGDNILAGALCGLAMRTTIRNVGVGPVTISLRPTGGGEAVAGGGIVGGLSDTSPSCVSNSYSRAALVNESGLSAALGGIAGILARDGIYNCYFAGTLRERAESATVMGGVVGLVSFTGNVIGGAYWPDGAGLSVYGRKENDQYTEISVENSPAITETAMKSADFLASLNDWAAEENTEAGESLYQPWHIASGVNGGYPTLGTPPAPSGGYTPSRSIEVTETSSPLFSGAGSILAQANMSSAFASSVEVKVKDTGEDGPGFGLGAGKAVYPFDISLYIKGTNEKTRPKDGYAVTISLPVPDSLLDIRD